MRYCQPSTTANSTDSPLSTPPFSPSLADPSPAIEPIDTGKSEVFDQEAIGTLDPVVEEKLSVESLKNAELDPLRPYIDPDRDFEYYDERDDIDEAEPVKDESDTQPVENEDSEVATEKLVSEKVILELQNSGTSTPKLNSKSIQQKFTKPHGLRFPRFMTVECFEEQVKDAEDMSYEELYALTAGISKTLVAYQTEWELIDKELNDHEALQKAEMKRAEEAAKQLAEEQKTRDDDARAVVQTRFADKMKLKGQDWSRWVASEEFASLSPEDVRHLHNLKNPQFMALANKKKRGFKLKEEIYEYAPIQEYKVTKEETNFEKRKRGKLIDPIKFDDMKTADVYGFDYSPHAKHHGAQPIEERAQRKRMAQLSDDHGSPAASVEINDSNRIRVPRRSTKRLYDNEHSGSPESDDGGLPAKRARRARVFEDGPEATGRSGSETPGQPRIFASGKRIGRPPKSKLQAVQMASETPTPFNDRHEGDAQSQDRELHPLQQAELQNAAELLVNQASADKMSVPPQMKKKHAGGRPKKIVIDPPETGIDQAAPLTPKPKNKGGRPRKNRATDVTQSHVKIEPAPQNSAFHPEYNYGIMQSTEYGDGGFNDEVTSSGRSKRKQTTVEADAAPIPPHQGNESPSSKKRRSRALDSGDQSVYGILAPDPRPVVLSEPRAMVSAPEGEKPAKKRKPNRASQVGSNPVIDGIKKEDEQIPFIDNPEWTPEERKARKAEHVKEQKSRKLSASMKARWATGRMIGAQETRRANNALKKAAKEAATTTGMAVTQAPDLPQIVPVPFYSPAPQMQMPMPMQMQMHVPMNVNMPPMGNFSIPQQEQRYHQHPPPPPMQFYQPSAPPPVQTFQHPGPPPVQVFQSAAAPASAPQTLQKSPTPLHSPTPSPSPTPPPVAAPKPPSPKKKSVARRPKPIPPPRKKSAREKKPTKRGLGLDGTDDRKGPGSEVPGRTQHAMQYASEYDRFQALTSPGNKVSLGKRVRKPLHNNLSQVIGDESEDPEVEEEEDDDDEEDDYSF